MANRISSIKRLPREVKAAIDGLLKEGRFSLDEILGEIRRQYGDAVAPSRSALGRYKKNFDEVSKHMQEAREIASIWTQKIGEQPESDIGKVAIEMLRTLAFQASQDAYSGERVSPRELNALALAMQRIEDAGRLSLARELALEKAALEKAAKAAATVAKKKGVSAETVELIRREILGISDERQSPSTA
ncbi:MAG TPA: DUF3486 family protein [Nevskiales bacterium]|nr:DUF3486 family protein [Nevskiales bacterium]